jgi:hypothetical protein
MTTYVVLRSGRDDEQEQATAKYRDSGCARMTSNGEIQRFWLRQNDEQRRNTEILSFAQNDDPYFIAC